MPYYSSHLYSPTHASHAQGSSYTSNNVPSSLSTNHFNTLLDEHDDQGYDTDGFTSNVDHFQSEPWLPTSSTSSSISPSYHHRHPIPVDAFPVALEESDDNNSIASAMQQQQHRSLSQYPQQSSRPSTPTSTTNQRRQSISAYTADINRVSNNIQSLESCLTIMSPSKHTTSHDPHRRSGSRQHSNISPDHYNTGNFAITYQSSSSTKHSEIDQLIEPPAISSVTGRPLFSAERHYAKVAAAAAEEEQREREQMRIADGQQQYRERNVWGGSTDILQFENMVMENRDEVMVEARSLLQAWVENNNTAPNDDVSSRVSLIPPGSHPERNNYQIPTSKSGTGLIDNVSDRLIKPEDRQRVVTLLEEILGDNRSQRISRDATATKPPFPQTQDNRITIAARQQLVRERRELQDRQRKYEIENRILETRKRLDDERRRREVEGLRKVKAFEKRVMEFSSSSACVVDKGSDVGRLKKVMDGVQRMEKFQKEVAGEEHSRIVREELEKKRREKEKKLKIGYVTAEELYFIKIVKCMRPYFNTWRDIIIDHNTNLRSLKNVKSFRDINRFWIIWRKSKKRREGQRHAEEMDRLIRTQHEYHMRAMRHYRMNWLSKVFLVWRGWSRLQVEERKLKKQHEERKRKMQEFLDAVATKMRDIHERKEKEEEKKTVTFENCDKIIENRTATVDDQNFTTIESIEATKDKIVEESQQQHQLELAQAVPPGPQSQMLESVSSAENDTNKPSVPQLLSTKTVKSTPKRAIRSAHDQKLLDQMELREKERKEKKAMLEQKRKEKEAERKLKIQQEEDNKREAEEAERKRFLEQKLEERRKAQEEMLAESRFEEKLKNDDIPLPLSKWDG
ncbi:hypothetical protein HDU76_013799 [Blyttiomyces sp. JEL0837]|nr:hypothetical protein HDU76_013799 [Blyttiomyces sp. JEL0837]